MKLYLSIAVAVIFASIATAEAEPTIEVSGDHGDVDVAAVTSQIRGLEPLIKEKGAMWASWENGQLIPASAQAKAGPNDEDFVYSFRLTFVPYNRAERIRAGAAAVWAPLLVYAASNKFIGAPFKFRITPALFTGLFFLENYMSLPTNKGGKIIAATHVDWPGPQTKAEKIIAFGAMPIVGGAVFLITKFF